MSWLNSFQIRFKRAGAMPLFLTALVTAQGLVSSPASAEVGKEDSKSGPKGTIGLSLLGAEAVVAVEAAFGVKKWWLYAIGGGAGAIAGGIGGYFIDKGDNSEASMALFVGGIVFAVPTTIAVLSATAYKPAKNPQVDDTLSGDNELTAIERRQEQAYLSRTIAPPAFVGLDDVGNISLKLPAVEVQPVFSKTTRHIYSLPSATAVRVPVFSWTF